MFQGRFRGISGTLGHESFRVLRGNCEGLQDLKGGFKWISGRFHKVQKHFKEIQELQEFQEVAGRSSKRFLRRSKEFQRGIEGVSNGASESFKRVSGDSRVFYEPSKRVSRHILNQSRTSDRRNVAF